MSNAARKLQEYAYPIPEKKRFIEVTIPKQKAKLKSSYLTKKDIVFLTFIMTAFAVATVFILNNHATTYQLHREIAKTDRTIAEKTEIINSLEVQVYELSSPDRILHIATEELGMEMDEERVVVLNQ